MAAFIDRAKTLLRTFLGTQDDCYILTEAGQKIQISDLSFFDKTENTGSWSDGAKAASNWTDKQK